MGFFDNSKIKKSISMFLASISIGGAAGCKKEVEEEHFSENEGIVEKSYDLDDKYEKEFENVDIDIVDIEDKKEETPVLEDKEDKEDKEEKVQIKEEVKKEENKKEKEDDLIKSITGETERERLENILKEKDWGQEEEEILLVLYDRIDFNYDLRGFDGTKKQEYLRDIVNTIADIQTIKIDPDNEVLINNGWSAVANYIDKSIILKFGVTALGDLRHEISHLEDGTFLTGSFGADLGFVCEEGRASFSEGDVARLPEHIDSLTSMDLNAIGSTPLVIDGYNGSYPAFEEIYNNFLDIGVDMNKIRRKELPVNEIETEIQTSIANICGDELAEEYMDNVLEYIEFFGMDGMVNLVQNEQGLDAVEARENMNRVHEMCMVHSRDNRKNKEVSIER